MSALNSYALAWRHINTTTFMYGTTLRFKDEGTYFHNPLMPSGTVIHDWHMLTTFNEDKTVPYLPILKKGQQYKILLNYDVQPQGAAYVKITFYRKNDTEYSYLIIQDDMAEFQFPVEAYAYKIELINAGLTDLLFKNIKIEEMPTETDENQDIVENKVNLKVLNRVLFDENEYMRGGLDG
ncbi:accessory Sec system protein Asp3 [Staphylococcus taiwanensis]|nr:accessory Sec system protein Asp3 [Staphylococcus taiwanensis]